MLIRFPIDALKRTATASANIMHSPEFSRHRTMILDNACWKLNFEFCADCKLRDFYHLSNPLITIPNLAHT